MCGIAGAFNVPNAAFVVSLMLKSMQHRGQDAAGIVSVDGSVLREHRGLGLVDEVMAHADFGRDLPGSAAIGHVRYSTAGDARALCNVQPLVFVLRRGPLAIAHNGTLDSYRGRRDELEAQGDIFSTASDTELFFHLLNRSAHAALAPALAETALRVGSAFSLLALAPDSLCAVVDPYGFRPLLCAPLDDGYVVASESCALTTLGISAWQPVAPGTVLRLDARGLEASLYAAASATRFCSFEHVYFTRPDSYIFTPLESCHEMRQRLGVALAAKEDRRVDLVTAVPDSSNTIALAYAQATNQPFGFALIRNHYMGRTFITPKRVAREHGVRLKLAAVRPLVEGRRLAVVDDSIVRGTTMTKVVGLLRTAGAKEVHVRIASPPVRGSCFWGIDTPERQELIASAMDTEALRQKIGADSLTYLGVEEFKSVFGDGDGQRYCFACFDGRHPTVGVTVTPQCPFLP